MILEMGGNRFGLDRGTRIGSADGIGPGHRVPASPIDLEG